MYFSSLVRLVAFASVVALPLGACQGPVQGKAGSDKLASGNLLSIGRENLVMQSEDHVMFVSVGESDKGMLLTHLKKGDKITLLGKRDVVKDNGGQQHMSADVYGIEKEDGTIIALNP